MEPDESSVPPGLDPEPADDKYTPPENMDDFLFADILGDDPGNAADPLETQYKPKDRILARSARKRHMLRIKRRERLKDIMPAMPAPGETYHIIGNSEFFFFDFVPNLIDIAGQPTAEMYTSTWATSQTFVAELLDLKAKGRIETLTVVSSIFFKRYKPDAYGLLLKGLRDLGGRYQAFVNHVKLFLMAWPDQDAWIACESSANFTDNKRMENYTLTNDHALYDFHKGWIEDVFKRKPQGWANEPW